MMKFNRRHKATSEIFVFIKSDVFLGESVVYVWDKFGECRVFNRDMMVGIEEEEWEDITIEDVTYDISGRMLVKVWTEYDNWEGVKDKRLMFTHIPCVAVRMVNSKIQRKKRGA